MKFGCPLCGEAIIGNNEKTLSAELRDHLSATHKLNVPGTRTSGREMGKGKEAFGAKETVQGSKDEGAFGVEVHGKEHRKERAKKGALGPQPEISVMCPFCDARIESGDADEMTSLLRKHMEEEHSLSS